MTTPPTPSNAPRAIRAPEASGPPPGAGSAAALDPFKIIKKYFWVLAASGVFGIAIGVGAFFGFGKVYPLYSSEALWIAKAPAENIGSLGLASIKNEELQRFMATQAATMVSERVLQGVVSNPRLAQEAPDWYESMSDKDGFNQADAFKFLENNVKARAQSRTEYITLSLSWHKAPDTASLVRLVTSEFRRVYNQEEGRTNNEQRDQVRQQINDLESRIERLASERSRLIENAGVDTLETRSSEITAAINLAAESLSLSRESLSSASVQIEEFEIALQNPAGITYPSSISDSVELDPLILEMKNNIELLEAQDLSLSQLGLGPKHPDRRNLRAQIEGSELQVDIVRETKRRELFDTQLSQLRLAIRQLRAREAELVTEIEERKIEQNELTRLQGTVQDIDRSIEGLAVRKDTQQEELARLDSLANTDVARRIALVQSASVAEEMSFPRIEQTVPAGFLLCVGLTAGLVVLREMLDQRVKGPADLASVRGSRVLGVLPELSEDPSQPKSVEMAFRDRPNSVFAESIRQLRTPIIEGMNRQGLKTLLVASCIPKSGATAVILNLAEACERSQLKVLVVDANFRRPSMHRVLGVEEQPGLADVLAGEADAFEAIQSSGEGYDVMPVGSEDHRIYERTSTKPMDDFIEKVESKYDLILIDVAPLVVAGDAVGLANHVDATLIVARAMTVKRGMVARLLRELASCRAELLGVVLNGVRPSAGGYFKRNIQVTHAYQNSKRRPDKNTKVSKKGDPSVNGTGFRGTSDVAESDSDGFSDRRRPVGVTAEDNQLEAFGSDENDEVDTGLSDTLNSDASPLSLDDLDPESTAHGDGEQPKP